jgi:hypothetical protein
MSRAGVTSTSGIVSFEFRGIVRSGAISDHDSDHVVGWAKIRPGGVINARVKLAGGQL